MLDLLKAPKSYDDMLNRIAVFTATVTLFFVLLLESSVPKVNQVLGTLSFKINDLPIPLGPVLVAVAVGVLSRMFEVHDRVSDLLLIRKTFDREEILTPLAQGVGFLATPLYLDKNRRALMDRAFYPFVKTSASEIDPHYVHMALEAWGWYWVTLEALVVSLAFTVLFWAFGRVNQSLVPLLVAVISFAALVPLYRTCATAAHNEVDQILTDSLRKARVREVFDEISR